MKREIGKYCSHAEKKYSAHKQKYLVLGNIAASLWLSLCDDYVYGWYDFIYYIYLLCLYYITTSI